MFSFSVLTTRYSRKEFSGDLALEFPEGQATHRASESELSFTDHYFFGPGYAVDLGTFLLGATLNFTYVTSSLARQTSETFFAHTSYVTGATEGFASAWSMGVQPTAGVQWRVRPSLSLGASVAVPSVHIDGEARAQSRSETAGPPSASQPGNVTAATTLAGFRHRFPARFAVGVSYDKPRRWAISSDLRLQLPDSRAFQQWGSTASSTQRQGLPVETASESADAVAPSRLGYSVHAGGERYLGEMLAFRGGMYYSRSPVALRLLPDDILALQMNRAGMSFGLGLDGRIGETTIGVDVSRGWGRTVVVDAFRDTGSDLTFTNAKGIAGLLFIAGSVDIGTFGTLATVMREAPERLMNPKQRLVSVAELEPGLAKLAEMPELKLQGTFVFEYWYTGKPKYDEFFRRLARMRACATLAAAVPSVVKGRISTAAPVWRTSGFDVGEVLRALQEYDGKTRSGILADVQEIGGTAAVMDVLDNVLFARAAFSAAIREMSQLPVEAKRLADGLSGGREALLVSPQLLVNLGGALSEIENLSRDLPTAVEGLARMFADLSPLAQEFPVEKEEP